MIRFSMRRAGVIARREYRTTVRRRAYVFTALLMPLMFGGLLTLILRSEGREGHSSAQAFRALGVVDQSGLYAAGAHDIESPVLQDEFSDTATRDTLHTRVQVFPDTMTAFAALRGDSVNQVVVIPRDYLQSGRVQRYIAHHRLFGGSNGEIVSRWLMIGLLGGRTDPQRVSRAVDPMEHAVVFAAGPDGHWREVTRSGEMLNFILPYVFAFLLGMGIFTGGQYLMQGVSEEKETRILESLLCTVTPEDLLLGKLLGLGGAGLTMVAVWVGAGALLTGQGAMMTGVHLPPGLLAITVAYFLLGFLFYGALMLTVGAVTSSMRESQQFSVIFSLANFSPIWMLPYLLSHPEASKSVLVSLIPFTAAVGTIIRMNAPAFTVPPWQLAASLGILALSATLVVLAAARIFRIALLLYGKTPNLPEILRWARTGR